MKTDILKTIDSREPFDRSDIQKVMETSGYHATSSAVNHLIRELRSAELVQRIGRNRYTVSKTLIPYTFCYSDRATDIAKKVLDRHPFLEFRIFELSQLNEFVNHQIGSNIFFLSVENGFETDVFDTLWEFYRGSVLLRPTDEEMFRYLTDGLIVIQRLTTESPKGIPDIWNTRIEKWLVDIAVDKLLKKTVPESEYSLIYRDALRKYIVERNMLARYARRRGALEKFRLFLRNEAGLTEAEFEI